MAQQRLRVGVVFGSRSVEHEVSIVTALQVMATIDRQRYEVVPIYITKEGKWLTGEPLSRLESFRNLKLNAAGVERAYLSPETDVRALIPVDAGGLLRRRGPIGVDVVFPCVHGTYGEDGTLQGLLELADLPYVGAGVVGAAVGMDKIIMKAAFRAADIPIVNDVSLRRADWDARPDEVIERIESRLTYPLFVKPANLGSSVGISKARDRDGLRQALEVAAQYDRRLLVEESAEGAIEINCSVLGNDDPRPSVCEQPVAWEDFLSYEDKYLRGGKGQGMKGQSRRIPAPISDALTARVQELAVAAFKATDCAGIARVDCLVNEQSGQVYVNEINTLPGSLSFYLWEPSGVPFTELTTQLIQLALERHRDRARNLRTFDSSILEKVGGSKGPPA
jgi:D-alanine-D-alanine ligase